MRLHSLSASRLQVERFNADHPIGNPVTYRATPWRRVDTRTASKAHMVGTDAVVFVLGQGRVPLDRVTPA
ncbi:hypothetical protein E6C67_14375 [Azospirillum sp. TSA2s]|uniref:hypothetical protein n=1 Tax=Azospirillum sp. TSA2s TaxID=709810 RepID=UPI0010AA2F55|nr:hypothetical protein [Azospirillum sp. TSA2s]QCG95012.1 hypothetical protein E6C67_14375 [Azospirillum sp. TSA2s]